MKFVATLPFLAVAARAQIAASSPLAPLATISSSSLPPTTLSTATTPTAANTGGTATKINPSPSSIHSNTTQANLLALLAPVIGTVCEILQLATQDATEAAQDGQPPAVEAALDGLISALEEGTLTVAVLLQGIERSRLGDMLGGQKGAFHAAVDGLQNNVADIGKLLRELVHSSSE